MFLAVSRSDVHFSFDHLFFAGAIGRASKLARPKSWVSKKKFFHSCNANKAGVEGPGVNLGQV